MNSLLTSVLQHLQALVAIDTQNTSGNADARALFDYVGQHLDGFDVQQQGSAANGDMSLHARRGSPPVLINIHVDTVPASRQWNSNPFQLKLLSDRAVGLGACDIKGALACWLAALQQSTGSDAALLLCSDEESGGSRGIRHFLEQHLTSTVSYPLALIAEPTECKAVTAHRGYASAKLNFSGMAGHSSEPRALQDNTIHQASRFLNAAQTLATEYADQTHSQHPHLSGICFNAGRITGGLKNNIIADQTELSFGCRPLPGQSTEHLLHQIQSLADAQAVAQWQTLASDPALPANADAPDASPFIQQLGLKKTEAVSFWTEAALFSAAGIAAAVCGPGNIQQAHSSDEWVALSELQQMADIYLQLLNGA